MRMVALYFDYTALDLSSLGKAKSPLFKCTLSRKVTLQRNVSFVGFLRKKKTDILAK